MSNNRPPPPTAVPPYHHPIPPYYHPPISVPPPHPPTSVPPLHPLLPYHHPQTPSQIYTTDQLYQWLEQTLTGRLLRAPRWYNKQTQLSQRGYIVDRVNRLMGYASLRQLRVKSVVCDDKLASGGGASNSLCNPQYDWFNQERRDFSVEWRRRNGVNDSDLLPEFTYRSERRPQLLYATV